MNRFFNQIIKSYRDFIFVKVIHVEKDLFGKHLKYTVIAKMVSNASFTFIKYNTYSTFLK